MVYPIGDSDGQTQIETLYLMQDSSISTDIFFIKTITCLQKAMIPILYQYVMISNQIDQHFYSDHSVCELSRNPLQTFMNNNFKNIKTNKLCMQNITIVFMMFYTISVC